MNGRPDAQAGTPDDPDGAKQGKHAMQFHSVVEKFAEDMATFRAWLATRPVPHAASPQEGVEDRLRPLGL